MTATLDGARHAARHAAWTHGPGKELTVDPGVLSLEPPPGISAPIDALAHRDAAAVAAVLALGMAPTRWDDWSNYNAHRPFPSARAKQAHHCWLLGAGRPGSGRRVDEVRGAVGPDEQVAGTVAPGRLGLLVRAAPDRIPAGYGPLRWALGCLETGHVAHSVLDAARRCGVPVEWRLAPGEPGVVLEFGPAARPATASRPRRCSGLDPRGLAPDPRPLPAATWHGLLAAAPRDDGLLRHRLAVHAVDTVADGVWEAPADGAPRLRQRGPATAQLARAFRGPLGVVDVAAMNTIWTISAPLARHAVDTAAYAEILLRAGMAAQQLCLAAAERGLFARPVRGVEEPDFEAALQLPPGDDLVYTVLLGRPRVHGFTYDLTPPVPAGGPR